MKTFDAFLLKFLDNPVNVIVAAAVVLLLVLGVVNHHYVRFVFKSLRRNLLRTILTGLATMVMVLVVTIVWSILKLVDDLTAEKSKNFKAIVTAKYQVPSQLPNAYQSLTDGAFRKEGDYKVKPEDSMTWGFFIGTNDPNKMSFDSIIFFFSMEPDRLVSFDKQGNFTTMMEDMENFSEAELKQMAGWCKEMQEDKTKVVVGEDRLRMMGLKAPCKILVYGKGSFQDLNLEVNVIGTFPAGSRYGQNSVMNKDYLIDAMDDYKKKNGKAHPQADKTLALVWLRVPDTKTYNKVAEQINESPDYNDPKVKCETLSSGIGNFLEAYRDLLRGMRLLLAPFAMATMAMVIAVAISISVRERRTEMAVLKVLGFGPNQIMMLVLGEAVFIGATSGFLMNALGYLFFNKVMGGIPFPIGFTPVVPVPVDVFWWGPCVGGLTAIAGSIFPAWTARSVKVSEVFSKIA
jgi:putative ABC transport system permease protein